MSSPDAKIQYNRIIIIGFEPNHYQYDSLVNFIKLKLGPAGQDDLIASYRLIDGGYYLLVNKALDTVAINSIRDFAQGFRVCLQETP